MAEIESESQFVWKFIWNILLTPITLVMIIFKKKQVGDLFKPFADFFRFVWEPKFTVMIILLNIAAFFYSSTFSEATMSSLPTILQTYCRFPNGTRLSPLAFCT